ncbi:ECF transporter S component [bacterium]|nr:ECF transporter S component [bacterium]
MTSSTRQLTQMALFMTLAVVVPILFHAFGLGAVFLPMFLPILISGFFLTPPAAFLVGALSPWLSALITGMPPLIPMAPLMSIEGAALAVLASWLFHKYHWGIFFSVLIAVFVERGILALAIWGIQPIFGPIGKGMTVAALTMSLPGIAMQLVLVPLIVIWLKRVQR